MKNKILAVIDRTIPYVKELRAVAGSVAATVLMQQLDFRFMNFPDGFYKFLEPCKHRDYREGDSWTEELAFSPDEFRTAFTKIGVHYKSKSQYNAADDKFQGRFYCSYHDRVSGHTFYMRNHALVDAVLDVLSSANPSLIMDAVAAHSAKNSPRNKAGKFTAKTGETSRGATPETPTESTFHCKPGLRIYGNRDYGFTETGIPGLDLYTEITSKITSNTIKAHEILREEKINPESVHDLKGHCHVHRDWVTQKELMEELAHELGLDTSSVATAKPPVKDPSQSQLEKAKSKKTPTPSSATPPPPPAALTEDEDGWLQMPRANRYKLARAIAARRMQFILLIEQLSERVEVSKSPDGQIWICNSYDGYEGTEEEMLSQDGGLSLRALRGYADALEDMNPDWYNETLQEVWEGTLEWLKRMGDRATLELKARSVFDIFGDVELCEF